MHKIIAITQPNFIPWLGYFEMIDRAHTFVYLDDAQYIKEWINRNKIRSAKKAGWEWLSVPIIHNGDEKKKINDTPISKNGKWWQRFKNRLKINYKHAPFFVKYSEDFFSIIEKDYNSLADLNISTIEWGCKKFCINTKRVRSSTLHIEGDKHSRNLEIIKKLEGNYYLANNGAIPYLKKDFFLENDINISFQDYNVPVYNQYNPAKLPTLSFLDLLFYEGTEKGRKIIIAGRPSFHIN